MASIVLGVAASRSPLTAAPPEYWAQLGERDKRNARMRDRTGALRSYDELLAQVDPSMAAEITPEAFQQKSQRVQRALDTIAERLEQAAPDFVVVMGDDEEEYLHADNRPGILVYRGETFHLKPRPLPPNPDALAYATTTQWGDHEADYPVAVGLCNYLVDYLINAEFDLSDSTKMEAMPHGFGFLYKRMLRTVAPIVPFIINVHYPPNQPTPKRCYDFGRAVRKALEAWDNPARVAVVANGGLSVSIIQQDLDKGALAAMKDRDAAAISRLPRAWMQGSTGEVLCWVAAAGALEHLNMDILDYVPGYRSPAGTGSGLGFAVWS